jgi:hypothetical protein
LDFLKSITGKVVSGIVALAVIAAAVSWYQMDAATRQMLVGGAGKIFAWLGVVLVFPWATFFLIRIIAEKDNNVAGAALVFGYTVLEFVLLAWLFGFHAPGATAWVFLLLGALLAGVYNLLACDWIAEKLT